MWVRAKYLKAPNRKDGTQVPPAVEVKEASEVKEHIFINHSLVHSGSEFIPQISFNKQFYYIGLATELLLVITEYTLASKHIFSAILAPR